MDMGMKKSPMSIPGNNAMAAKITPKRPPKRPLNYNHHYGGE